VAAAAATPLDGGFCFNKDAGLLQCPAGELATRAEKRSAKNGNTYLKYVFRAVMCRQCPLRERCRVGKSKARCYSITQPSEENRARLAFENSEAFREKLEIRHRIEEKNGEMKVAHGLTRADSVGLDAVRLQTYFTVLAVNVKRMVKLLGDRPFALCYAVQIGCIYTYFDASLCVSYALETRQTKNGGFFSALDTQGFLVWVRGFEPPAS
jgi:hypothetical protein